MQQRFYGEMSSKEAKKVGTLAGENIR